jgi:hypothetical protein
VLKIQTNASYSDADQFYAAGYLEAAFTHQGIYDLYNNILSSTPWSQSGPPACLTAWLDAQDTYVRSQIIDLGREYAFWNQLGLVMSQVR